MIKRSILITLISVILLLSGAFLPVYASPQKSHVDTGFLPVSNPEWDAQMRRVQNNPLSVLMLVGKANMTTDQKSFALGALERILKEKKINSLNASLPLNLMAAYIMLYDSGTGIYASRPNYVHIPITSSEQQMYQTAEIYADTSFGRNNWLVCLALGYEKCRLPMTLADGSNLIKRAVYLAPHISYTHYFLGRILTEGYTPNDAAADKEFIKALELEPPCASAAELRLEIAIRAHNRKRELEAKREFLERVPDSYVFPKESKDALDKIK